MKIERINKINELLKEQHTVTIDKLCDTFNVSKNTIRRDIVELEQAGLIRKVYGGIVLESSNIMPLEPFSAREIRNIDAKKKIAAAAAACVSEGDVIYIDSGTTTMHMIPHLLGKSYLTIVTASVYVLDIASRYSNLNVIATGGALQAPIKAFVGPNVLSCIKSYNFSKIFLAATGISLEHGATNASPLECEIKQCLVQKPCSKYLLADSSKFDVSSLMTYGDLKDIDCIVTNGQPPEKYQRHFNKNDVGIIIAS